MRYGDTNYRIEYKGLPIYCGDIIQTNKGVCVVFWGYLYDKSFDYMVKFNNGDVFPLDGETFIDMDAKIVGHIQRNDEIIYRPENYELRPFVEDYLIRELKNNIEFLKDVKKLEGL